MSSFLGGLQLIRVVIEYKIIFLVHPSMYTEIHFEYIIYIF